MNAFWSLCEHVSHADRPRLRVKRVIPYICTFTQARNTWAVYVNRRVATLYKSTKDTTASKLGAVLITVHAPIAM